MSFIARIRNTTRTTVIPLKTWIGLPTVRKEWGDYAQWQPCKRCGELAEWYPPKNTTTDDPRWFMHCRQCSTEGWIRP